MTKFIPALALLLAATPAFAQGGATQSPPAPNAASRTPGLQTPGLPSGSTGPTGSPSDAMNRTVPQPVK